MRTLSDEDIDKIVERLNKTFIETTKELGQENKQLKEELKKYKYALKVLKDTKPYKEIFEMSGVVQERDLYKEVIKEVREYIDNNTEFEHDGDDYGYTEWVNIKPQNIVFINELLQILDKAKGNK